MRIVRSLTPVVLCAAVTLLSACTSRRMQRENAVAILAADAQVLQGCYDCLLAARDIYERLAASLEPSRVRTPRRATDSVVVRLFETQLLLALREKELAVDWQPSLDRASGLVPRLPAGIDGRRLLAIVDAVLPDATGRPNDWPSAVRQRLAPFAPGVPREVTWVQSTPLRPVVREYLALALDCSHGAHVLAPTAPPGATRRRPVLAPGSPPLIVYRTGICMGADDNMLAAALALVPAFPEAAYHLGTNAAFRVEEDGGATATRFLAQAYARFPRSPGVTFVSGFLADNLGDCRTSIRYMDETIAIDPTHELAWLNRTECLSRTHQDTAAVASATRLLALETRSAPQAYYWRAVSRLRLRQLTTARADIDSAKAMARTAEVLTVAGVIEYEQHDLPAAEKDLREARGLFRGEENCTAAWTLGLVLARGARPKEAAEMFEAAMTCHDLKVSDLRYALRRTIERTTPANADYMRRRVMGLEADSADQRSRYFASAFNGAGNHANAGNLPRAEALLGVAAADPKLAGPVAELRAAIVAVTKR